MHLKATIICCSLMHSVVSGRLIHLRKFSINTLMENNYIIDSAGKKRKAVIITCAICGKQVLKESRFLGVKNYCSAKCRGKGRSTKIESACSWCSSVYLRNPSKHKQSKSGFYFCSRQCKDLAQRIENNFIEMHPSHYNNGNGVFNYRTKALECYPNECEVCKYNKYIELLQVHHIDSNRSNADLSNLIVLCPTCHWGITLRKASMGVDRMWVWKRG